MEYCCPFCRKISPGHSQQECPKRFDRDQQEAETSRAQHDRDARLANYYNDDGDEANNLYGKH